MDVQASFAKLWRERFPGESPPSVFHVDETMNNNNTDKLPTSGVRQSPDAFRHDAAQALLDCEKRIETIEADLTRQKFLKDYLVKFLESEVFVSNGLSYAGISELNHPGVNFPDPGEVKVGEVCTRVVRGKRSRMTSTNNVTGNESHTYDNRPSIRYHGKRMVPPPSPATTTTTTTANNTRGVTINKAAVNKCESRTVGCVASDSQPHLEKLSEADNSQSDKSTLTDPPVAIYNHKQPPAVKPKPKPPPLPVPKRQRHREDLSSDTAATEEPRIADTVKKQTPADAVQTSVSGTGGLNSLHTAENSCVVAGKAGQPGFVSSSRDLGHDSLGFTQGRQKETRHTDSSVQIEPSKGTPRTVLKKFGSADKAVDVSTHSGNKGCVTRDSPDQDPSGGRILQQAGKSVSGIQVDGPVSSQAVSTADTVSDTQEDTMIRKLTHKTSSNSESVTGLKYKAKNNYEVVELPDNVSPCISSGSDCKLLVGSPKDDHFYENSIVHTPLPPLPDGVSGNGVSSVDESTKRISTGQEFEDTDQAEIEEESLYETLAVGKSFHAALTAEDESFDSLSLYSDNETVRSDASADSGMESKASVESHPHLVSAELSNSVDTTDPYAELYATVCKLKHDLSPEVRVSAKADRTAASTTTTTSQPEQNTRQKRVPETRYEYVDIADFQTPDPSYNSPGKVNEPELRQEKTRPAPVPQRHDYEECFPPGLEEQRQSSDGQVPAEVTIGHQHTPVVSTENISGSPVCMRRDHPVSQPSRNCDSDGTIGSNRNSSPVSELDACSTDSEGDHPGPSSPEKEKLRLRKLVLQGILETERDYLTSLEVLLKYKKSLEAAAGSSQPVMSLEDIKVVFSKIPELHIIHEKFVHELAERVNESTPQQRVGDLFKMLISSFPVYSDYMKNYPKAVETIGRCSEENLQFRELANMVPIPNSKETLSLQNMLFKPVVRIQRNTLVLHDLINCTPKTHPDYEELLKAKQLTHLNLEEYGDSRQDRSSRKLEEQQHLVKNSFLVALEGGRRKLRYVFLFNDVIICTKQKISGRSQRHNFEVKWFASLTDILLTDHRIDQQGGDSNRESRISNMDEVEDLKKRVIALKTELRAEIKKAKENEGKEKSWSFASRSAAKAIEKQKKKLHELEAALVQASPNLPFKINHKSSGKSYVFLMSTDYEREEWSEAIIGNQAKVKTDLQSKPLTPYDIQMLIENVKQLPKVNRVGNALLRSTDGDDDNDGLSGVLNVTIHRLSGLTKPSDTFCCLELDLYGHFFMTARTNVCRGEKNPVWDEEFEIDLDGSQTLRILCYRRGNESEGDVLLGKSALELKTSWLEKFHEKEISLNEYSLMVSIRYVTAATTMKRLPSRLKTGVFGVKITNLVKREGRKIPTVVTACVDEIEKRGMDETGIYRVSGVTSDVQRLKKAFDKNSRGAMHLLSEFDIHAVSGVLKLYFRELPEPLFTEALYCNFIDSLALADAEAKEKCMLSLLHSLPDPSLRTVLYLIDHLIRVSHHQNENRMNLHNLATIFGPTLLRPAAKDPGTPTPDMLFLGAQEALSQTAVLHYFITLRVAGKDLNKPATKASKLI